MAKFMVLYRAPVSAQEQMANSTPDQVKAGMEAWMTWASKAGDAIIDLGSPLRPDSHLGSGSNESRDIAGFSILQADSAEAVTEVLNGHPHLGWGGSLDILEFLTMPGMG
jgi:hypothetical protein